MKTQTTHSTYADQTGKAEFGTFNSAYYEATRSQSLGRGTTYTFRSVSWPAETDLRNLSLTTASPTQPWDRKVSAHLVLELMSFAVKCSLEPKELSTVATGEPDDSVSDLLASLERGQQVPFGKRLAARLRYLLEVSRDESPEQAPPCVGSLSGFLAFVRKNPQLAYPDVVLTPEGNVRARWRRSRSQHFALEFLKGDDVRFVVFAPDPKHPYKTVRASGTGTMDSIMELVHPYRVLDWAKDER